MAAAPANADQIKSTKNKTFVIHEGYLFRKDKAASDGGWFMRCVKRSCTARIKTDHNLRHPVPRAGPGHNHIADPSSISVRRVVESMKTRAGVETTSLNTIYREETARLPIETQLLMPTLHSVDAGLYRARQSNIPPIPQTRNDFAVAFEEYVPFSLTHGGETFLQTTLDNNNTFVFCTALCLQMLCMADRIFMDGSFSTVPNLFQQLFTIHSMLNGRLMPRVYVLMALRTQQHYVNLFRWLRDRAANMNLVFQPAHCHSDFETGLLAALHHEFPGARHHGCYFHFTQAIWRNVQQLGLANLYHENGAHRALIRQLMALAFLPVAIVRNSFELLYAQQPDQQLEPLFQYFNAQWLEKVQPIAWNVYGVDIRTNNHVEGR